MSRSALVSCLFFTAVASAEPVTVTSAAPSPHPWGLETELVQPFLPTINIVRLTGTRTLWGSPGGLRGDVMVGGRYRLQTDDAVAQQVTELLLSVGYRQYFWRGLHAEAFVAGGWLAGTNRIDGKRYSGAGFALSATAGYRFGFFEPGGFFAPEILWSDPPTPTSDAFAAAAVLWWFATGGDPFGDPTGDIGQRIIDGQLEPFAGPPELGEILVPMLARDPAARPSAAESADRLAALARRWDVPVAPFPPPGLDA